MKSYLLLGVAAINHFQDQEWKDFEISIEIYNGVIVAWNKETDSLASLLDVLRGWTDFIILTEKDLKKIQNNTAIIIERGEIGNYNLG